MRPSRVGMERSHEESARKEFRLGLGKLLLDNRLWRNRRNGGRRRALPDFRTHDARDFFQRRNNFLPIDLAERVGGQYYHPFVHLDDCPWHVKFVLKNSGGIPGNIGIVSRDGCRHDPEDETEHEGHSTRTIFTVLHMEYRLARTESDVPRVTIITRSPSRYKNSGSATGLRQGGKSEVLAESIASDAVSS